MRQYLPVTDRVQLLDWYILSDLDPRVADVQVREWLAGLPCRDLGGMRLGGARGDGRSDVGLPEGRRIGHHIVEVWDADFDEWFCMETTALEVGPAVDPRNYFTKVRGCLSSDGPLGWGYASGVMAAEQWSADGAVLLERASLVRDDSPEGIGQESHRSAGNFWRVNRDGLEENEDKPGRWLDDTHVNIAVDEARMDPGEASLLKQHMAALMDSAESLDGRRWFPLWALWFAQVPVPATENRWDPPPTEATPFVAFVIALAGPQIAVDVDLCFTRRYLLLPDPRLPAELAGVATPSRVLSAVSVRGGSPPPLPGAAPCRIGPRGGWAWNFLGNLLYFCGSPSEAPAADVYPRFDCPGRVPGVLDRLHPLYAAGLHGPPFPTDLDDWNLPTWAAGKVWAGNLRRLADYAAFMGRDPVAALGCISADKSDPVPDDENEYLDWFRKRHRLIVNPWGDLAAALRDIAED